jgi:class 3 adenylate cyclase
VSRALKFTLLIGIQVSIILAIIGWPGWLHPLDVALSRDFGLGGRIGQHPAIEALGFVCMAFGIAWTTIHINEPQFKTLVATVTVAELFTFSALVGLYGTYLSPILPAAAVLMAFGAGFVYSRSDMGQRQQVADEAFGQRLAPRQMRELVDGNVALEPTGQVEVLTLVACEIFNHDQLMDALEPAQYAALTNRFMHCATEVLVDKGGTLAACDGEGVRVIFGAPLPQPAHAAAACRAALEVARQVRALNETCAQEHDGLKCDLRIGINSGDMAAGRFGTGRLGGFGVAGEEVAFARRLCAANLIYGSTILLGARTFSLAEATIEARPLELLRRRVGDEWLEVYELLGEPHDLSPEDLARRDLFWTGVIFYREKRLGDALEKFTEAQAGAKGPDGPLDFYIQRIKHLQHGKTSAEWETTRLLNSL